MKKNQKDTKKKEMQNQDIHNLAFFNARKCRAQKVPPIWFMRQAGRYHKHYQKLRKKHSFMELCKNAELSAEVALGPIEDFDFDVAILFSDLLFPLEIMGLKLSYNPSPVFERKMTLNQLKSMEKEADLEKRAEKLKFQKEALLCTRERLPHHKSLIGFVGGPWTLFTYAVEPKALQSFLRQEEEGKELFNIFSKNLLPILIKNIQWQLEGKAEVVMIFDSGTGKLNLKLYSEFMLPLLQSLSKLYPERLGYYSKGLSRKDLVSLFSSPWAGFGYDQEWSLGDWPLVENRGFFQGNFNPSLMLQDFKSFEISFHSYLSYWLKKTPEERKGWVCGLGHGVLPKTPEENVRYFVKKVREVFC